MRVTDAEHATVLAALRTYQESGYGDPFRRPERIHDIATNLGEVVASLDDKGIENLIDRLNYDTLEMCPTCGNPFASGDQLVWTDADGAVHLACV